jgi:hypothetical protein
MSLFGVLNLQVDTGLRINIYGAPKMAVAIGSRITMSGGQREAVNFGLKTIIFMDLTATFRGSNSPISYHSTRSIKLVLLSEFPPQRRLVPARLSLIPLPYCKTPERVSMLFGHPQRCLAPS